jgi:hypothetical protein
MSGRYLGVISLERFLVVERYRESHQPASPANPLRRPGADSNDAPAAGPGTGAAFPASRNACRSRALRS